MQLSKSNFIQGIFWSILITVVLKLILTVVAVSLALNFKTLPVITTQMDYIEFIPKERNDWYFIASPFYRFDALWYELVGKTNYQTNSNSTAFFPLFPWIVMSFSMIFKISYFISAYFLSTFFTITALVTLFLYISVNRNRSEAVRVLLAFAFFPTGFFLLSSYAEPLMITLFFSTLIAGRNRYYLLAGIFGMLTAMTKPYGWIVIIPLLGEITKNRDWKRDLRLIITLMLIPLGTALIYIFQNLMLKGTLSLTIPSIPTWRTAINPALHLLKGLKFFIRNPFDIPNSLNLFSAIGVVILLYKLSGKKDFFDWAFVLIFLVLTLSLEAEFIPLISFSRHVLLLYPLFTFVAREKFSQTLYPIYLTVSSSLMVTLFIFYSLGFFVG